jgi:hypothetical protein
MRGILPKDIDEQIFDLIVSTYENVIIKKNTELLVSNMSTTNATSTLLVDDCVDVVIRRVLTDTYAKYLDAKQIDSLIDFLRQLLSKILHQFRVALNAYFTYLKLNDVGECSTDVCSSMHPNTVLATLRIIKLLVKYSTEMRTELDDGLDKTATSSWCGIIPQLFCRLSHANLYVREFISGLLCRIARDYSHLIIYPTIVGSIDGPTKIATMTSANTNKVEKTTTTADEKRASSSSSSEKKTSKRRSGDKTTEVGADDETKAFGDLIIDEPNDDDDNTHELDENNDAVVVNDDDEEEDDDDDYEDNDDDEKQKELKNNYKNILNTLNETNSKMISEVKLFIIEMRRITLLREELWLGMYHNNTLIKSNRNEYAHEYFKFQFFSKINENSSHFNTQAHKSIKHLNFQITEYHTR